MPIGKAENILIKVQDLLLYTIPILGKLPRDQKFVLGDRIEVKMLELQESLIVAYYDRERRREQLREANLRVETIRALIRLCHALRLITADRYEVFGRKIDEIGRMVGGWEKAAKP